MRFGRTSLPFLIYLVLFVVADAIKATVDPGGALTRVMEGAILALLCWITSRLTDVAPEGEQRGRNYAVQLALCAIIVIATLGIGGFDSWRTALAAHLPLPIDLAMGVANVLYYVVPIVVVFALLQLPFASFGLGRFRRGWAANAFVWLVLPVSLFVVALVSHRVSLGWMGRYWFANLLENGFSEEFLFRGAILGRLRVMMSNGWAIFVQALLFGLWHMSLNLGGPHGMNLLHAVAESIANQASFGYALGFLALRTGNVAIASAFHMLYDSLGDIGFG